MSLLEMFLSVVNVEHGYWCMLLLFFTEYCAKFVVLNSAVWDLRKVLNVHWHITVFVCPEVTLFAWKNVKIQIPLLTQLSTLFILKNLFWWKFCLRPSFANTPVHIYHGHFLCILLFWRCISVTGSLWFFPVPLCWGCSKALISTLFLAFRNSRASLDWALVLSAGSSMLA